MATAIATRELGKRIILTTVLCTIVFTAGCSELGIEDPLGEGDEEEWTSADRIEESTPSTNQGPFTDEEVRNAINEERHNRGVGILDPNLRPSPLAGVDLSELDQSGTVLRDDVALCAGDGVVVITVLSYETQFDSSLEINADIETIAEDTAEDVLSNPEKEEAAMSEKWDKLNVEAEVGEDGRIYIGQEYCGSF